MYRTPFLLRSIAPTHPGETLQYVNMLEAELFAFLENTADAVFLPFARQAKICFWNQTAEALFGHPAEEVLGKNLLQCLLASRMNGEPLPGVYGAPLRLRVENQLGYKMVKWIERIEFIESEK